MMKEFKETSQIFLRCSFLFQINGIYTRIYWNLLESTDILLESTGILLSFNEIQQFYF